MASRKKLKFFFVDTVSKLPTFVRRQQGFTKALITYIIKYKMNAALDSRQENKPRYLNIKTVFVLAKRLTRHL